MALAQRLAITYIRTKFALLSAASKKRAARSAFLLFCTPQYRNRKKLPHIFTKAEVLTHTLHGTKLRGYRWNHPSPKKFLIMHGFESSVINFDRYVKPMIRAGYEVICFDAPGHGRSSGKRINILLYKAMIADLEKTYGPFDCFLAHSLGGLTASLYLEEHGREDQKLVMIAPAAETTRAIDNFFSFLRLDKEVRKEFEKHIYELGKKEPSWFSIVRAAEGIKSSVLLVQDKDDPLTPYEDIVPLLQKAPPNYSFLITEGLGHSRIYRDNKVTRRIIQFLTGETAD